MSPIVSMVGRRVVEERGQSRFWRGRRGGGCGGGRSRGLRCWEDAVGQGEGEAAEVVGDDAEGDVDASWAWHISAVMRDRRACRGGRRTWPMYVKES